MKPTLKIKLAIIALLLLIPLQVGAEIERNGNLTTVGTVDLAADTEGLKPAILSLNTSEDGSEVHVKIKSEPNATVGIHQNSALLQTLQTDDSAQTETTLTLKDGFNSFTLVTIDYWGNKSEPTELVVEKDPDLMIFTHETSELNFSEADELAPLTTTEENSYSIVNLNKDHIERIPAAEITITDSDFLTDTDGDHQMDAIEIVKGDDPKEATPIFTEEIDVIDLDGSVFTNSSFFVYGTAPVNYTLRIYLRNQEGANYQAWSGRSDATGTFNAHTPFPQEGTFTLIIQALDENGVNKYEKEHGEVTYDRDAESVPLTVNAHYKVNSPTMHTSIFSIEEIGRLGTTTIFGPDIDLQFQGETNPLSEIFILWKGESEWFLQTVSHPESGTFAIESPDSVPSGDYTTYIYSRDLRTSTMSDIVRANFNVTSTEDDPDFMPLNTVLYILAAAAYLCAIGWVSLSIKKHIRKPSASAIQQ
jgi:hypothetical protein